MAKPGVHTIASAFPKVKIVTASVDPETNEEFHIVPGIGNYIYLFTYIFFVLHVPFSMHDLLLIHLNTSVIHQSPRFFFPLGNFGNRYFGTEFDD